MDASHAISIAVKQQRAVARSALRAIVHLCSRVVVSRTVIGHVGAFLSESRPGFENLTRITWWPQHVS